MTTDSIRPAIELQNLCKHYDGVQVVDCVNLAIPKGEFFALLGPNGAGKTTTLRMLLGLTPIDAGSVRILDMRMPQDGRRIRTRVGVVPQFDTLDPDFTVKENLLTYASYFQLPKDIVRKRIETLLELVNLETRRDARIQTLSGGMKRRLTLARALINEPEIIILDEPTTGLDPQARHHIWRQLRRLRERGVTMVLTTHYMEEAEELCDRVAIIDHGRIVTCAPPRELIAEQVEPWVFSLGMKPPAGLLPNLNELSVRLHEIADTWLLYTASPDPLRTALESAGIRYSVRPANLEDVFLKLTGHELRD